MFTIDIDPRLRLVSVDFAGFLAVEDVAAYVAQIKARFIREIGGRPYLLLIDTNACGIQSQDVVRRFQEHIAGFPKAARIALVSGTSLARMQIKRIIERDYARLFDTRETGLAWLLDGWPLAAAVAEGVTAR